MTETDAEGRVTRYDYDPNYASLIAVVVDQGPGRANLTTNYGYDSAGNRTLATDGNGQQTTYDYDAMRRVVTARPPSGSGDSPTTYLYDQDGRRIVTQRATSIGTQETRTNYLPSGQPTTVIDPSGNVAYFNYSTQAQWQSVTDSEGRTTYTFSDANARVFAIATGGVFTDVRLYTPNGLLSQRGGNNGTSKVVHGYNGFDRLIGNCYQFLQSNLCDQSSGMTEQFAYTVDDDLIYRRSRKGQEIRWTYNALHLPATKTISPSAEPSVSYTYDLVGRQLSATVKSVVGDPSTGFWWRHYDPAGRLQFMGSPDGRLTGYGWDNAGKRTLLCVQNAGRQTWNACFESIYDTLNRHVSTRTNSQLGGSVPILWTDYFDALGRLQTRAH